MSPFRAVIVFFLLLAHTGPMSAASTSPVETFEIGALEALIEEEPHNLEAHYQLGVLYHHEAQVGSEESLHKALERFQFVFENDPSRNDARAFYGSATVLKAKYASIFSKLKHARAGFAIIDETIESNPNDFAARLVRAANASKCPRFLGRKKIAEADFQWLLSAIEKGEKNISDCLVKIARFYAGNHAFEEKDPESVKLLQLAFNMSCPTSLDSQIKDTYQKAKKKFGKDLS